MARHLAYHRLITATCAGSALLAAAAPAAASNPLEYPDNGSAAFSRGGAWLATATDPIAAHYNPAAIATQRTGFSIEALFAYQNICYSRRNPGNQFTGPNQGTQPTVSTGSRYAPVCNDGSTQPRIIPSLGFVWRATDRLALGFAVVPPATYGSTPGEWDTIAKGRDPSGRPVDVPAPYRFMTVGNRSTILHPTWSVGFDLGGGFRIGAGFIWSVAVIDVESFSVRTVTSDDRGDNSEADSKSRLRTEDLFVPGAVASIHWSIIPELDVAVWGRWIDAINATNGDVDILSNYFDATKGNRAVAPVCRLPNADQCTALNQSIADHFGDEPDIFKQFKYVATPPEVRAGVRFHVPRAAAANAPLEMGPPVRDPLRDDVFDIELNGSYTMNSVADKITIRFQGTPDGRASVLVRPLGRLPPRADRPTGYKDSYGVRLGGQYNLVANRFGLRAGTWFETAAADAEWLNISPVPAARGGFGGGVVYRQGDFDFSIGYQRHWSPGLDNKGNGKLKAGAGSWGQTAGEFRVGQAPDEQQFRTFHTVNGGRVTQSADVFTAGGVYRF